jgi:hypothetical protein
MKLFISLLLSFMLCNSGFAEGKSSGGDDFRKTAMEYQEKAKKYNNKGKNDIAALYQRMAEIKLDAAAKADEGKWDAIDWSEYHKIEKKISEKMHSKK